jgi:hypothetical protein
MPLDTSDTGKFAKYCALSAEQSTLESARGSLKLLLDKIQISLCELCGEYPNVTKEGSTLTTTSQQEQHDE